MEITLSVVVVNLNNKDLTVKCLNSIRENSGNVDYEVILVDNGSEDNSIDTFNKIKDEDYWKNKLTLINNKSNKGYAIANNQGIREAKGKYILLLNNDTIVRENALQKLLDFANKTSDAGVIGSKLLNLDGSAQASCYHFPGIANAVKEYILGIKGSYEKYLPYGDEPVSVDSVVGAVFLITPQAKRKVGLLDERYFAYFEDLDYCRRVWKKGLKVYYLPQSEITHYHGATFTKMGEKETNWRKLIPSSIIYNGIFKHYMINAIIWVSQKLHLN